MFDFQFIAFVEHMKLITNSVNECEARIKAYMRMLRVGEGTGEITKSGKKIDFQLGYTTAFGGNKITDLKDHPRKNYGGSSAAGAYQIMGYTWDDDNLSSKKKKYKINSFSKEDQDKFCMILLKYHPGCSSFISLIINGEIEKATRQCGSRVWASLPYKGDNSRYKFKGKPQPATPMKKVLEHYNTFLKEELEGKSPLHLKDGFLKEFGYDCSI